MEIYADVVFGLNFVMDIFILWVAGKLARRRAGAPRLCLGAFIMSFTYCALAFFAPMREYLNIFASVTILMIGVAAAFHPRSLKEFALVVGLAYISAFALGGMGMAFFYFTNMPNVVGNALQATISNFSVKILIASTCAFYIAVKLALRWYNRRIVKKQVFYPVKIFYGERDAPLTALLDTGNSLKDPISKAPVLVAEFDAVKRCLPDKVKLIFYENNEDDLPLMLKNMDGTGFSGRMRMIPFASLGTRHGMLIGFRPDKVEIENDGGVVTLSDVIVGVYNAKLTGDGAYQGLLHPELVN